MDMEVTVKLSRDELNEAIEAYVKKQGYNVMYSDNKPLITIAKGGAQVRIENPEEK